jgi:hypothetical protein
MPVKTGIQPRAYAIRPYKIPGFLVAPGLRRVAQFVDFVESIEQLFGFGAKPKPARHSAVILHLGQ